jgi:hypothetical protein
MGLPAARPKPRHSALYVDSDCTRCVPIFEPGLVQLCPSPCSSHSARSESMSTIAALSASSSTRSAELRIDTLRLGR